MNTKPSATDVQTHAIGWEKIILTIFNTLKAPGES